MCQAGAVQVALVIDEDLRLVHQAPERSRVDNAVAIALILAAIRWRRFGVASAAASRFLCRIFGETFAHFSPRQPGP